MRSGGSSDEVQLSHVSPFGMMMNLLDWASDPPEVKEKPLGINRGGERCVLRHRADDLPAGGADQNSSEARTCRPPCCPLRLPSCDGNLRTRLIDQALMWPGIFARWAQRTVPGKINGMGSTSFSLNPLADPVNEILAPRVAGSLQPTGSGKWTVQWLLRWSAPDHERRSSAA